MTRRAIASIACVAILLISAADAWQTRTNMNADGISYLDLAGRALQLGPGELLNRYWSPLFPALLAVVLRLLQPSPEWLFPAAQLTNWLTLVWSLGCFTYLVLSLRPDDRGPAWTVFAYAVFLWGALRMMRPYAVGPDYLLSGMMYLSAGLLLRAENAPRRFLSWLLLGAALALGYLSKFVLWPMSLLLLATLPLAWKVHPRSRVAAATLVFAVVAGPWIASLSKLHGSFTAGEAGALNLAWTTPEDAAVFNTMDMQIRESADGLRLLHTDPLAFAYGHAVPGTYPLWYDPAFWHQRQGTRLRVTEWSLPSYGRIVWANSVLIYRQMGGAAAVAVLLLAVILLWRDLPAMGWRATQRYWLFGWPLAGFAGYAGTSVEPRYIAPLGVLLMLASADAVLAAGSGRSLRTRRWALLGLALVLAGPVLLAFPGNAGSAIASFREGSLDEDNPHWRAALHLRDLGLRPPAVVASVGSPFQAFFLKLAGLRVVAEVPEGHVGRYCALDAAGRRRVREALFASGGAAIIAPRNVPCLDEPEWRRINGSIFRVLLRDDVGATGSSAAR